MSDIDDWLSHATKRLGRLPAVVDDIDEARSTGRREALATPPQRDDRPAREAIGSRSNASLEDPVPEPTRALDSRPSPRASLRPLPSFPPRPRPARPSPGTAVRRDPMAPRAPSLREPNRRVEARRPVHIGFELLRRDRMEPEFAVAADLSSCGAFLLVDSRLPLGDVVRVSFVLPWSNQRYGFLARVVRIQRAKADEIGALFGFGLEFVNGTEIERERLRRELQGIPPMRPFAPQAN